MNQIVMKYLEPSVLFIVSPIRRTNYAKQLGSNKCLPICTELQYCMSILTTRTPAQYINCNLMNLINMYLICYYAAFAWFLLY